MMAVSDLKSITVEWAEADPRLSPTEEYPFTVSTYEELQDFLEDVFNTRDEGLGGYSKVKVHIEWENGDYLTDRVDVGRSRGDFNPNNEKIGPYLRGEGVGSKNRGTMYGSSFQYETEDGSKDGIVTETSRDNVSWSDTKQKKKKQVPEIDEVKYPMLHALYTELSNLGDELDW
tara:strand:+ start:253 stop:774 length:522 start_codon:yes stop_codon:yes gene_type:complete